MEGSGWDHSGPARTAPGGPGPQPAACSVARAQRLLSTEAAGALGAALGGSGLGLDGTQCDRRSAFSAQRSRRATFFVHYQEKDGVEERLNSEVTEFTFISPKVVSMSDSVGNRKALTFLSVLRPRPVLAGLQVSMKKQQLSSRETRRGVGVQLPKVFPLGPLPAALSSPAGYPLSFHGWDLGRGLLPGSRCLGGPHDGG